MAHTADEINHMQRYTMWSVFRSEAAAGPGAGDQALEQLQAVAADTDLVIRGWYDVAGLRADADLMVWWHAHDYETLQRAYHVLRASSLGNVLTPVWSQLALHRAAEFNKAHVPAFLADEQPRDNICVYPFVRSHEWYLLPDEDRAQLLADHGRAASGFADVRANTMASFGLGDYEWILCFEADEMARIVDLMRVMRTTGARRHVRVETPFYSGRRRDLTEIVNSWG
ncbi:hydrogen peroxide-dependent heme synthase [Propionibacterium freudenreichii]|uniref:Coproheme decarboxylase n=1 Tax=Propionibacterium freudenreichii TaxID=1744 RepID=A0A2C7YX76_9ACTN|nr:hydrogen peroxide-dependent heme synthase [Propionibacterium freudenreichii]MCT2984451.1 chlorite dismutase [Propionibacterium freudenreichii]MCT2988060.1 chlorite dismutase [Propionibacterium freudenreichii]MCT3016975.1 chlorite dismutase [Propionibacterium freudenreichii]MDK9668033.1 chlorite dismutase family protein [Propionibacterium freudenreichii]MDK9670516.1 chlorite dismutase family protein [Propionibacterium freudenreichii]